MLCRSGLDRRATLKLVASGGVALAGIKSFVPSARAATALTLWTGYPELVPYYKAVAEAYAKSNPGFSLEVLSTTLREAEQKLAAALPTGTGPDIFDAGTAVSIKFITAGLLEPNPPAIDQYMKSGAWDDFTVNFLSVDGKTYGLPLLEGRAAMYYNKAMFEEAGLAGPPSTFPELMDAAVKLTRRDADGKMTRSGVSMRLSGQGSGICEKFRFVLEPAGGSLLVPAGNGKWHSGFDNEAGRGALQFYVDVVQKEKVDDPRVPHDAQAFVTGATAMLFREAWVIGEVREKAPNLEFGVAPIPAWTAGGQKKAIVQPWPIYVSSQSENQDAGVGLPPVPDQRRERLPAHEDVRLELAADRASTGRRSWPRSRSSRPSSRRRRTWFPSSIRSCPSSTRSRPGSPSACPASTSTRASTAIPTRWPPPSMSWPSSRTAS